MPSEFVEGYCPDCGAFVITSWYLVRCSCCNIKRDGVLKLDEVLPKHKYCSNCGEKAYYVEKVNKIQFYELGFAVAKREVITEFYKRIAKNQAWAEQNDCRKPDLKLLSQMN